VPGPGRRTPPCPHFATCGGCDLQHLEDRRQLAYKVAAVRESLTHIGKISLPEVIPVVAGDAWGYRLRAQLHTDTTERGLEVGYYARGSRDLVPIDCCPVLAPELEKLVPALPDLLRDQPRPRVDLAVGDGDKVSSAPPVDGLPRGPIKLTVGAFTYRFDARCFFQGHRGLLPELVAQVIGPWEGERAFDLFAGVGLFTLPLAERYGRVVAVEGNRIAARYAQQNVGAATGIGRVSVENLALESWIEAFPEDADRAIVDPPRAGLPLRVCAALIAKRPRILTYVSCHAATLARDLRELQRGYRIESIRFIDLFPQTGHLETIVHLRALEDQPGRDSASSEGVSSEGPTQAEPAGSGRGGEEDRGR
jgi:23S rRNA (uracil1939-C5)-methyltransferase